MGAVGIGMMRPESPRADGGAMSFREACRALGRRAMRLKSADAALAASDTSMKKCLTAADLILLGVGGVIGYPPTPPGIAGGAGGGGLGGGGGSATSTKSVSTMNGRK